VQPKEILVLRPNDLGDLLTTTPIFQALKGRFPSSHIIAGVGSWGKPILANNPYIHEIAELDAPWNNKFVKDQSWKAVFDFLRSSPQVKRLLNRNGFDVGIDVLGSHVGAALMMRLGVRYRVGVRGYRGGWSACHKYVRFSNQVSVSKAALAQAEILGATVLPQARPQLFTTEQERNQAAQIWGERPNQIRLLVGCGGGLEGKRWPAACLGNALRQVSLGIKSQSKIPNIILVGDKRDSERGLEVIAQGAKEARSLCGDTTLRTTFALTEQADMVLTSPSMLLHVAAAFCRPTLAILGGMFSKATEHDQLWGYPAPYRSIAPKHGDKWPTVEMVAAEVIVMARQNAVRPHQSPAGNGS
jgi:ADP-heptose:LPS heptosyltransferase